MEQTFIDEEKTRESNFRRWAGSFPIDRISCFSRRGDFLIAKFQKTWAIDRNFVAFFVAYYKNSISCQAGPTWSKKHFPIGGKPD